SIGGNDALTSLGFSNLTTVEENLFIQGNTSLTSISELNNLISVGNNLMIGTNTSLTSLTGLNNLASIGGNLEIRLNDSLPSLTGLDNLTSLGGYLHIKQNNNLNDISSLQSINPETIIGNESYQGLVIIDNPILSVCNLPNLCTYLTYDSQTHT